jgi:hypothetical protein
MQNWNISTKCFEENTKVNAFIKDLFELYTKHNLSIAQDGYNGSFTIEPDSESNRDWLKSADFDLAPFPVIS